MRARQIRSLPSQLGQSYDPITRVQTLECGLKRHRSQPTVAASVVGSFARQPWQGMMKTLRWMVICVLGVTSLGCGGGGANSSGNTATPSASPPPPPLAARADATRLLEQATFGPTQSEVAHVQAVGIEAYLAEQFALPKKI